MATKKERLSEKLRRLLEQEQPAVINRTMADRLRSALEPMSPRLFRSLLRECNYPLDPLVEGVRQENLEALERTLLALAQTYRTAQDAETRRACRKAVITGKEHARLAARMPNAAPMKNEMILWMLTWLENPEIFEYWAPIRKHQLQNGIPPST